MQRILVIEDEPGIADTITYALQLEGFEPIWCPTGNEGKAVFAGGNNTPTELVFSGGHAAVFTEYAPVFGRRKRLVAGLGLELGYARQAVRTRTEAPPPLCSARGEGVGRCLCTAV